MGITIKNLSIKIHFENSTKKTEQGKSAPKLSKKEALRLLAKYHQKINER